MTLNLSLHLQSQFTKSQAKGEIYGKRITGSF
jgi:hypothetical protein